MRNGDLSNRPPSYICVNVQAVIGTEMVASLGRGWRGLFTSITPTDPAERFLSLFNHLDINICLLIENHSLYKPALAVSEKSGHRFTKLLPCYTPDLYDYFKACNDVVRTLWVGQVCPIANQEVMQCDPANEHLGWSLFYDSIKSEI